MDVSVIFATKDRASLLADTLRALERQNVAGIAWEVIVVDNASTDRTPEVLQEAAAKLPLIDLLEQSPGKNRALNRALDLARGDLLLFTDDDVIPDSDWIAEMVAAARRWPEHSIFGGRIVPRFPAETPMWLKKHRFTGTAYAHFELPQPEGPMEKLPFGPNFMVRATAMRFTRYNEAIGPLGEDYVSGSETELLLRLMRAGHKIIYVPGAVVDHVVRPDQLGIPWLLGRSYRLGRCYVELDFVRLEGGARVGGVPLRVWGRLVKTWAHALWGGLSDEQRRFDHAVDYHFLRGCIRQHRLRLQRATQKHQLGS